MALWLGKITLACPSGRVVRKLTGTPDEVIKRSTSFSLPGCSVKKVEIVKRGIGAGARDRYDAESPFNGFSLKDLWPFKKKRRKKHVMAKTVMYERRGGALVNRFAGAKRKRKRRR